MKSFKISFALVLVVSIPHKYEHQMIFTILFWIKQWELLASQNG